MASGDVLYDSSAHEESGFVLNGATYSDNGDGSVTLANASGSTADVHLQAGSTLAAQGAVPSEPTVAIEFEMSASVGVVTLYAPYGLGNSHFDVDHVGFRKQLSQTDVSGPSYNFIRLNDGASITIEKWLIWDGDKPNTGARIMLELFDGQETDGQSADETFAGGVGSVIVDGTSTGNEVVTIKARPTGSTLSYKALLAISAGHFNRLAIFELTGSHDVVADLQGAKPGTNLSVQIGN